MRIRAGFGAGSDAESPIVMRSAGFLTSLLAVALAGCRIGPDYAEPLAPKAERWTASDSRVDVSRAADPKWWRFMADPKLDELVVMARRQNPSLRAAGLRVLQAQALRAVTIGNLFPQTQQAVGTYARSRSSRETGVAFAERVRDDWSLGFDAAWELDLWGRFRRAIESADAELLAASADYEDVLVSLVAEVAANYVQLRVVDERLALASENVGVQAGALEVATVRFESGGTSDLDVQQATALLRDTEARIPELLSQRTQVEDALAFLLGVPPGGLGERLAPARGIPAAPPSVAVGIPADLIRRRPDVRRAERRLAAQSARIGVAASDLYPRLELVGSIGLRADQAGKLFDGEALEAAGGPRFIWPILNYGRIVNGVAFEDARFEELAAAYVETALGAERDVEDALAGYVQGVERVRRLEESAAAAARAVEIASIQYREGAADFTRVLTAQQAKLESEDRLALARGGVTLNVVALYKALGGGWEAFEGEDVVPEETRRALAERSPSRWFPGLACCE